MTNCSAHVPKNKPATNNHFTCYTYHIMAAEIWRGPEKAWGVERRHPVVITTMTLWCRCIYIGGIYVYRCMCVCVRGVSKFHHRVYNVYVCVWECIGFKYTFGVYALCGSLHNKLISKCRDIDYNILHVLLTCKSRRPLHGLCSVWLWSHVIINKFLN